MQFMRFSLGYSFDFENSQQARSEKCKSNSLLNVAIDRTRHKFSDMRYFVREVRNSDRNIGDVTAGHEV